MKYKIVKEPDFKVLVGSFEAEAFFEGTDDGSEVAMRDYAAKIPIDCCIVLSDKEAAEEEERWVLSEYI